MKPTTLAKPTLSDKAQAALTFSEPKRNIFNAPEGHKRLTINLQEDLHKSLRQAALDENCTATDIITTLLRAYFISKAKNP